MKIPRFWLVLLGGLLGNTFAFAQLMPPTLQGRATQEMFDDGFVAAAPSSYPLDSRAKITNTETGMEIEVTIVDRILPSPNRIVDLSFDAWEALDLGPDTVVSLSSLYVPPAPESRPAAQHTAAEPVNGSEKPATAPKSGLQPLYHLLVLDRLHCALDSDIAVPAEQILYKYKHGRNGYLVIVYTTLEEPVFPPMPDKSRLVVNIASRRKLALREYAASALFRRFVTSKRVLAQLQETLADIKVVPGLPRADSDKTYRLQVGAFPTPETAAAAAQILTNAGFTVGKEPYGSLHRVIVEGIPSSHVAAVVRRLEFAGFTEVWIREN